MSIAYYVICYKTIVHCTMCYYVTLNTLDTLSFDYVVNTMY